MTDNQKRIVILFLVYIIGITIYSYFAYDSLVRVISTDGLWGSFWYFFINPVYIMLFISIILFNKRVGFFRNIMGSALLIFASDIISFPRLSSLGFTQDINLSASLDGLIISKMLSYGFSYSTTYILYYLIIPILSILLALYILGYQNFYKQIIGNVKN